MESNEYYAQITKTDIRATQQMTTHTIGFLTEYSEQTARKILTDAIAQLGRAFRDRDGFLTGLAGDLLSEVGNGPQDPDQDAQAMDYFMVHFGDTELGEAVLDQVGLRAA